jgi:succinate dehydrogenase/fumarate reductase flavoprotein subunit
LDARVPSSRWDKEADVVVVGCGLAGATSSVRDAEQRAQDAFDQPIPRLYVAGEISSIFGHLYLEAGNITECFIGDRIAGKNTAALSRWG